MDSHKNRQFELPLEKKKSPCAFFNKPGGCKNGSKCTFLHETNNWREIKPIELTPENEIDNGIRNGSLNIIFNKMVTSYDDYEKYYKILEWKFRPIAIWRLQKKSIKKNILDTLVSRDLEITNGILPYGYIPLCLYFICNALSWNYFNGEKDYRSLCQIDGCFDEIEDCISKLYDKDEFKDVIKEMTNYTNPKNNASILHVITDNLDLKMLEFIKTNISKEDFNNLMNQKTLNDNKTPKDWFEYNTIEKLLERCTFKYNNAIKRSKDNNDAEIALQIYNFNKSTVNDKRTQYYNAVFKDDTLPRRIRHISSDESNRFETCLNDLFLSETKLGIPHKQSGLIQLLSLINLSFKDNIDKKIHQIALKLPSNLFTTDIFIRQFKEYKYITNLWNSLMKTITIEQFLTICPTLLIEFFKESQLGIREAYIGEYIQKIQEFYNTSSNKEQFMTNIQSSVLLTEIKIRLI